MVILGVCVYVKVERQKITLAGGGGWERGGGDENSSLELSCSPDWRGQSLLLVTIH